ncbi:hypothetical protein HR45_13110 [Shewanella mangrovi]|uniref:Hydrolase TatD n=1 Tax=Shewanella mangrovi TaxID=1515746 RepID=A0A094JAQ1_9GAMM|nr:hypothetical protein HR45_13110 [Shewanella mangrovi]
MTDTHAHLDFVDFDPDRDDLFQSMRSQGIGNVILPGVEPAQWPRMLTIAQQFGWRYALGIHPWYLPTSDVEALEQLEQLLQQYHADKALVAVGECGLDKLRAKRMAEQGDAKHWQRQRRLFEQQLGLAEKFSLPLIVHAVQCHGEMLPLLQRAQHRQGGVIHGFSGSFEVALQYWQLGFRLGIGGLLLNPAAKKLRAAAAKLPVAALLVETDSPDMTPINAPFSRNTPLTLLAVVAELAHLRNLSVVQLSEQLEANCVQLFER